MEPMNACSKSSPVNIALKRRPEGIPGLSLLSLPEQSAKNAHCRTLFSPGPTTVLSPVTNLTLDMNNLAGLGRYSNTVLNYNFHIHKENTALL